MLPKCTPNYPNMIQKTSFRILIVDIVLNDLGVNFLFLFSTLARKIRGREEEVLAIFLLVSLSV